MEKSENKMSDFEQLKSYYLTKKNKESSNNLNKTKNADYKFVSLSVLLKPLFFVFFAIVIEILNFRLLNWNWALFFLQTLA